jgi:regulator of cell morphogenesis and NO signaling
VIYQRLKEFYEDMVQHLHLENNILYPKVKEIEQHLLGV